MKGNPDIYKYTYKNFVPLAKFVYITWTDLRPLSHRGGDIYIYINIYLYDYTWSGIISLGKSVVAAGVVGIGATLTGISLGCVCK